jgi:hypothetical protein
MERSGSMRAGILIGTLVLGALAALAADIVTMPTANQLKQGQVELADYYLDLSYPGVPTAPRFVHYQTAYVGLTNYLELDVHHAIVDRDANSTVLVASAKLLSESPTQPDVVVGVRNFTNAATTNNLAVRSDSKKASYYISTAKTFFKYADRKPGPPLVRLHASYGTSDWTLLGQERHNGLFGGMQFLALPWLGGAVEYDGRDTITALTYMPVHTPGLTIKAGTYGPHQWLGVAYQWQGFGAKKK